MADYTAHTVGRPSSNRTTVGQELDFLASLLPVERASIERIEAGGVFAGILEAELAEAAATRVELRSGWFRDVVRPALKSGAKVSILSVNWSAGWIREALKAGAVREGGDAQNLDKLEILSNDLVVDDEGITTGKLTRWFEERNEGIWTAKEKKLVLDQLVGCEEGSPGRVTVYVGDSSTDLEAALAADVGIYIGDKQVAMTARVGIDLVTVPNIRAFLGRKKNAKKPMLVKVSSMEELGKFLGLGRN